MSQATEWGNHTSGPASPTDYATREKQSFDALLSMHSGSSRPAYAVLGTQWADTSVSGKIAVKVYDGAADRLNYTIDTATGTKTFAAFDLTADPVSDMQPAPKQYVDSSVASAVPAGTSIAYNGKTAPTGYLKENGAAYSRSTYAALFAAITESSNVSISIASPGVVTWNAHGLIANDPVRFSTTGALPTGLTANTTTYYVVGASITTNTFQVSATAGGAAINTSGTQSGVHTALFAPFGYGDGTTTFNVPDSRAEFVRGWDDGRGVDTGRNFGSAQASSKVLSGVGTDSGGYSVASFAGLRFQSDSESLLDGDGDAGTSDRSTTTDATGGPTRNSRNFYKYIRPRNVSKLFCIKY